MIPENSLKNVISYRNSDRQWHSHSNCLFTSENRLLFFDISIGNTKHSFSFSFEELEKNAAANAWIAMRKDLPNVGTLEITTRRRPADKNYVLRKKEETIKKLGRQVEMLEQFNGDAQLPAYSSMTGNVKGFGGISLLHAAIELVSTNLVKRLLVLDADVEASSTLGSPIEMAKKLYQRAEEKYEDAQRTNKPFSAVEAYHQRCMAAKKVLDLLLAAKVHRDKRAASKTREESGNKNEARHVTFATS